MLRTSLIRVVAAAGALAVAGWSWSAAGQEKAAAGSTRLTGTVIDAGTKKPIPCRIYIRGQDGKWHFPRSAAPGGTAVEYKKQRPNMPDSVEMHTTLSAGPFAIDLPPGKYEITVERGKEYATLTRELTVGAAAVELELPLRRWFDAAAAGWYSGDTHVHRTLAELPNVVAAEDLNVAFPLTHWVTEAYLPPTAGRRDPAAVGDPKLITVDATHVIWPLNTEYEIFTVDKKPHTLGAVFVLNHKSVPDRGVPPVGPVAQRAREDGALLELDKHNWPWSMAIVPLMSVDLFELSNNHVWRTQFGFTKFAEEPAEYMKIETDARGFTERGWLEFGFANYYALLNCGFRMRPTAGTATGVHPVPLGFGRVYVHLPDGFDYGEWVRGLNAGRSFVSTGPMLFAKVNGEMPGYTFRPGQAGGGMHRVTGAAVAEHPIDRIEIVINGEVARTVRPGSGRTDWGAFQAAFDESVAVDGSCWIAVRCWEDRPDRRPRWAHTAPVHVEVAGKPLRPRKAEVEYLIRRVDEQIKRSSGTLPAAAIEEYRQALAAYRKIAETAR
jgi:hypothetical protein